jgi:hypothetical protein
MKPDPENVSGKLVESHEFSHSVEHQVNWSHFLLAIVLIYAIAKLGPVVASAGGNREEER